MSGLSGKSLFSESISTLRSILLRKKQNDSWISLEKEKVQNKDMILTLIFRRPVEGSLGWYLFSHKAVLQLQIRINS